MTNLLIDFEKRLFEHFRSEFDRNSGVEALNGAIDSAADILEPRCVDMILWPLRESRFPGVFEPTIAESILEGIPKQKLIHDIRWCIIEHIGLVRIDSIKPIKIRFYLWILLLYCELCEDADVHNEVFIEIISSVIAIDDNLFIELIREYFNWLNVLTSSERSEERVQIAISISAIDLILERRLFGENSTSALSFESLNFNGLQDSFLLENWKNALGIFVR